MGYGFLLLRDGLLGPPTLSTARREYLAVGWSSFQVVDAAWTMSVARELCMDCVALLIDVHNNKASPFIPTLSSRLVQSRQRWQKENWRLAPQLSGTVRCP